ncbi:MAG TPA: diguanylate cyclase [Pyrinomonadaceae bacterium]|nr:diguanylate cyclase [Pyrinomonadaceae bacterium]
MPRQLMDNTAPAPERAAQQATTTDVPAGWPEAQKELAAGSGLSLLLVEGRQPPSLVVSNNNSICQAFQSSPAHAHRCQPDCGEAYFRAVEAGAATHYRCHAGLHCFAAPVELGAGKTLAVIGGRAFLRGADYRALAERVRAGDLTELLSPDLFRNVIFALRPDLDELAERVAEAAREFSEQPGPKDGAGARAAEGRAGGALVEVVASPPRAGRGRRAAGVSHSASKAIPAGTSLEEACHRAVRPLVEEHGVESLALLLRSDDQFYPTCVTGHFQTSPPRVTLQPKEIKLLLATQQTDSIAVPAGGRTSSKHEDAVELFPLLVGDEIKGALLVGDRRLTDEQRQALVSFCRDLSMPLEVMRLRDELERRMRAATHLQAFTEVINTSQPDEAYAAILRHSAELLRAERGSLLLYDERAGELAGRAAVGPRADVAREARVRLGDGVAGTVLREGRPVVVRDVATLPGWDPAPAERSYKTGSFISYPIIVGGRKVGVLNVTDKAGGGSYDEFDLNLLELIAPQMALAIDRAEWHRKATQFQLLSITDPLTGLVNRRYLEERLSEELERSKRHRFAMSFMMVDIDDFKSYNDRHGHQAGDLALEMTAQCLKTALRSADVAARYGGEEFSILLPQTGLSEARVIGERIRRRVERTHFPHGKSQPQGAVTVSIGVSAFGPELDTPASVINGADQALYAAKSRGKNCVSVFETKSADAGETPKREKK